MLPIRYLYPVLWPIGVCRNEVAFSLYELTKNPEHLVLADYFCNDQTPHPPPRFSIPLNLTIGLFF